MQPVGRWYRVLAFVVFVVVSDAGRADAAPILSFGCDPDCSTVDQNSTFELEVRISDVVDLVTYSFYLAFDPAVLRVNNTSDITEGSFLGGPGAGIDFLPCIPAPDPADPCPLTSPLLIGGSRNLPLLGVSGSGVLAKILFDAWGFGDSGLELLFAPCDLVDPTCEASLVPMLFDGVGEIPIDAENIRNSTVFVDSTVPVPEPATIGLLGLGLLGVARRVRIQRQRDRLKR